MRGSPLHMIVVALVVASVGACGDDDKDKNDTDTNGGTDTVAPETSVEVSSETSEETAEDAVDAAEIVEPPAHSFAFGLELGQSIGDGPFPNDVLLGVGGIEIAALTSDARWGGLANGPILERTHAQIERRKGFSFASSVYFPMNIEPDLATFEGAVKFVALTGPEKDKIIPAEVFWRPQGELLGVFPTWGNYLVPGAKYAVIIGTGVKAKDGSPIETHPDFAALMAASLPGDASAAVQRAFPIYKDLRDFMAVRDESAVIGTVFTTEETMPYLDALIKAARGFPLVAPTRRVRSTDATTLTWEEAADVHGATALADYFGVASDKFEFTPGGWDDGNREAAKAFTTDGKAYAGGTYAGQIGWVMNGSIVVPSFNLTYNPESRDVSAAPIEWNDNEPKVRAKAMIPFSLFVCKSQLSGDTITATPMPVAIFTHGGTALRSDAVAFANVNCLSGGRATISLDMPFHGGRQQAKYFADPDLIVPTQADIVNTYKAKDAGGRASDYIGDNGGPTITVGSFFALPQNLDPEVIEANHLAVAIETDMLVRYLKEEGPNGLGAALGVKFDTSTLVHESLSFGTSFGTAFLAESEDVSAAIVSVGSTQMLSINLPMAPNNATLASSLFVGFLGVKSTVEELTRAAYRDPIAALLQWLSQRGDPMGYAPFVLKHRQHKNPMHVLGFGDSWDETLFTPAQITFANAWGIPVFETDAWKLDAAIPGADTVDATTHPGAANAVKMNLTVGDDTVTAGYFYFESACHAEVVTPLCESNYQPPYPPPTPRAATSVFASPICQMQQSMATFLGALTTDDDVTVAPPGDGADPCAELYSK